MKKRRFRPFLCQCCLLDPLRGRQIKGEAVEGFFVHICFWRSIGLVIMRRKEEEDRPLELNKKKV